MDYVKQGKACLDLEAQALRDARDRLGPEFGQAVALMLEGLQRRGTLIVTGVGKSLHVAQKISSTLASTGAPSFTLHPSQAAHGDLGILRGGDVLLALSYSGESEELIDILPLIKRAGVRIVAITGQSDSALARASDVVLDGAVQREACPFNLAPTASTTLALALGDALAITLLHAQGVQREDYARLHPAGAIGRSLLLRACDLMRSPDRLVQLGPRALVQEAILTMTRARTGSAGIVDEKGVLIGIFTDGDLRRSLTERPQALATSIDQVMTLSPVAVHEDQLAVDVLRVFEEHKIDDLPVVDDQGRLAGIIDIQDLPKFKIL